MHLNLFEALMMICFGASWPFSIWKSWKSREVGSKSLVFLILVLIGYLAGIVHKILSGVDYVLGLYILNALMVATDMALFLRNRARQSENKSSRQP